MNKILSIATATLSGLKLGLKVGLISLNAPLRVYLHGSKLAFKPSFKPTKVDAAVKIIYFGLKRFFSYPLNQPSNQPSN